MFPVLLLSTVFGVLFAFCGLLGGVVFFIEAQQGMSMSAFLQGFATATWPLAAACALLLAAQILKELNALREATEEGNTAAAPSPEKAAPQSAAPLTPAPLSPAPAPAAKTPVYFPVRETPQGPRIIRPAEESPAPAEQAAAESSLTFFKTH